jgi:predicted metal-dependent HD superfamily phosphohydrolase
MENRNFLLLLSASAQDKAALGAINSNITRLIDANAKPLWFDASHAGYFISSPLAAHQIWAKALQDIPTKQTENLRDILVLEVGQDYAARSGAKTAAWLNSHGVPRRLGQAGPLHRTTALTVDTPGQAAHHAAAGACHAARRPSKP